MIVLWDHPLSPYAQKVKIAMREKGLAFETQIPGGIGVGGAAGDFVAANPRAEVPALSDGDVAVFDSTIILEYLEDAYPDPALLPASAADRARVRMIEEPMREVDLPPRELPVLDLLADETPAATIEPRGLWIVGANGRLDLRRGADHHLILDRAANFEEPDWVLVPLSDRRRAVPLDRSALSSVLQ